MCLHSQFGYLRISLTHLNFAAGAAAEDEASCPAQEDAQVADGGAILLAGGANAPADEGGAARLPEADVQASNAAAAAALATAVKGEAHPAGAEAALAAQEEAQAAEGAQHAPVTGAPREAEGGANIGAPAPETEVMPAAQDEAQKAVAAAVAAAAGDVAPGADPAGVQAPKSEEHVAGCEAVPAAEEEALEAGTLAAPAAEEHVPTAAVAAGVGSGVEQAVEVAGAGEVARAAGGHNWGPGQLVQIQQPCSTGQARLAAGKSSPLRATMSKERSLGAVTGGACTQPEGWVWVLSVRGT